MPIQDAIKLLEAVDTDKELRSKMYTCSNKQELSALLAIQGFVFNDNEFEDAITHLHVQCQTLEDAQSLLHKAEWLRFLLLTN